MIYRGYDITQEPSGQFVWKDERGFIHNGKVDTKGGYETEEQAMDAIDQYRRNITKRGPE